MNKIKTLLRSKVTQNGIWLLLLQIFNTIVPLITLPYVTRILSKAGYGQFSAALNWISYFQVIVEFGFGLSGARRIATRKSDDEMNNVHSTIIISRTFLMIICFALFGGVIYITNVNYAQFVCMLILFIMVIATVFQQTYFFQGIGEMQNITIINMLSRLISVTLIFVLVKEPSDLYLYCFLYASNYVIASLFGCIIKRKKYAVKFKICKPKKIVEAMHEGWYLFVSSAMSKIFGSIGITILTFVAPYSEVGVYSAINKVPYVLTILFSAISQALYPYNCKAFGISYRDGVNKVKKVGIPIFLLFVLAGFAIILLKNIIVRIAFGSDYSEGSILLIPFVIWVLFSILNNFLGVQTLVASGHQKEYSRSFTISVIIMLSLMVVLGEFWGALGIAVASMMSEIILTCILLVCHKKIYDAFIRNCVLDKNNI